MQKILLSIVLVVAIVAAGYWYLNIKAPAAQQQAAAHEPITVHHSVSGTKNIYTGEITLPACTLLGSGVTSRGNLVSIALMTSAQPSCTDSGSTTAPFSIAFTPSSGKAVFGGVTLDGTAVPNHVVEGQ